jgi:histone chaperone ASF1
MGYMRTIDLEWKVIYVGCAEDSVQDQTLEEVMVGPVPVGQNRFVLQAPAPDPANIASSDLIGVTVVLVTCSFMDHEFVRIGYYVNNEYTEPYEEGTLPNPIDISKLRRNILAAEPRVTRFAIDWTGGNAVLPLEAADEGVQVEDDGDVMNLEDMGGDDSSGSMDNSDNSDESDGDANDANDIDLEEEGDEEVVFPQEGAVGSSPVGSDGLMIQEDSNSMDVGMMQSNQPALY